MPTPEQESADDGLVARLGPQALLARGLDDPASTPPTPTPHPTPTPPSTSPLTSASEEAAVAATLAAMFPEFHFEGLISRGGFGTVYRAEHRQMKRRVALKILSSALTRNVSAVARFEREIAAIGTLDHPGIVRAFDAGQRGGVWFLAMELVEGADFSTLSRTLGPLPPADACELIRQAALAIQHAHERDLIHRDIKPSNLMLTTVPDGSPLVKVLDFGLAQLAHNENTGGELTLSGELLGTVDYIAPEQIENASAVNARADVYGLGATLYRLLAGQAPHQATDATSSLYAKLHRITHEACPSIAVRCPELAPALVAVVDRMVARDPAQRFATAREVADALAPFAEASQLPALLARVPRLEPQEFQEPLEPLPRSARRPKFNRIVVSLLALAALAVVSTLVFLNTRKSPPPWGQTANLLADGGFELGQTPGTSRQSATYGAWTAIGSNGPALLGMPYAGRREYEGANALDLGHSNQAGLVRQSFPTTLGRRYLVSLWITGLGTNADSGTIRVYDSAQTNLSARFSSAGRDLWGIGGSPADQTDPAGSPWGQNEFTFTASGTLATLELQNLSPAATTIDHVTVTPLAAPGLPRAPEIELSYTEQFDVGWNDSGSTADLLGCFWRPRLPAGQNLFRFGDAGTSVRRPRLTGREPPSRMLIGKALVASAFAHPVGFTYVWNDAGSRATLDGWFFNPIPPAGYVSLGTITTSDAGAPSLPTNSVVCVRSDLVVEGSVGDLIWNEAGSRADRQVSLWQIVAPPGAVALGTFIGTPGHAKPAGPVYCLSASAVIKPAAPAQAETGRGSSGTAPPPTGVIRWPLEVPRWLTLGADGSLYGGTWWGGDFNHGGLYKFVAPTSIVTLVHFTGTNGPAKGHGSGLQLLQARDGAFYGVTEEGGCFDRGTVFRFDPTSATASFTTLVEFNGTNGAQPRAGLIEDKNSAGTFYGATLDGGERNFGTIFRITYDGVSARHETLVHLTGDTGAAPGRTLHCAMVQAADGTLYGTTHDGGTTGVGTVFKLTTDGRFTSLASFGQPPLLCYNPHAGLTLGLDGNLYGHCRYENKGFGAAFRLTPAGEVQVIARFGPPHGTYPASTLFRGPDGNFYGTTFRGGPSDQGTVFKLTSAGELTTLAAFVGIGPASDPDAWATPILAADGNLYGTTERGGAARRGTIYRVTPNGELTTLVEFFKAVKQK